MRYYKKYVLRNENDLKRSVYVNFDILTEKINKKLGHFTKISLHSNLDPPGEKFYEEDVVFYFLSDDNIENKWYIEHMGFEEVDEFPNNLLFIAGYFDQHVKVLR